MFRVFMGYKDLPSYYIKNTAFGYLIKQVVIIFQPPSSAYEFLSDHQLPFPHQEYGNRANIHSWFLR